jgi:proteic killer suppression protein
MIESFKNKALKRYWTKGDASGIRPDWLLKIRLILSRLDMARSPAEMDVPGLGFHELKGNLARRYSLFVSRNWRITFDWHGENATEIDLEDYHDH